MFNTKAIHVLYTCLYFLERKVFLNLTTIEHLIDIFELY